MDHPSQFAIILGASWFPKAPKLAAGKPFYNSAADFMETLLNPQGLGFLHENVCWLFDDGRSPSDQLEDISEFLVRRVELLGYKTGFVQDLILFYVGHGLFTRSEQAYCLAVRSTSEHNEGATSIRASDLAMVIKESARFARRFLIFDCCFSANLYKEFQSGPLSAARTQLMDKLPSRGTALLCSSSARDPSLAPRDINRTMFSDALLTSLHEGSVMLGSRFSFSELGDLVVHNLMTRFPDRWIRPEVSAPDQREGDISSIPLFPNFAYRSLTPEADLERARLAEEHRRKQEAAELAEEHRRKQEANRTAEEVRLRSEKSEPTSITKIKSLQNQDKISKEYSQVREVSKQQHKLELRRAPFREWFLLYRPHGFLAVVMHLVFFAGIVIMLLTIALYPDSVATFSLFVFMVPLLVCQQIASFLDRNRSTQN